MTLSVLEGHSPIASLSEVRFLIFVACCAYPVHLQSFLVTQNRHVIINFHPRRPITLGKNFVSGTVGTRRLTKSLVPSSPQNCPWSLTGAAGVFHENSRRLSRAGFLQI